MKTSYSKTPITIEQQVQLLKERGLIVRNDDECAHFLRNVSYYRLGWYCKDHQDPKSDHFRQGVTFEKIKTIYITDQRLRNLIAESVDRIEVALRSMLVNESCCYFNDAFWHISNNYIQKIIVEKLKISKGYTCPFTHYNDKYRTDANKNNEYPFWLISEFLFFSEMSLVYANELKKYNAVRKAIAKEFGLKPFHLAKCLHSLSILRNAVAHHDKIYKRVFPFSAKIDGFEWVKTENEPFVKYNFFINHYYIIDHLLSIIHPNNSWRSRVDDLLFEDTSIAYRYGFQQKHIHP